MLHRLRRQLRWKLFLSYVVVIAIGLGVLAATTQLVAPREYQRHFSSGMPGMGRGAQVGLATFRRAVNESVTLAAIASTVAAVAVSWWTSRRVVGPVRAMRNASQRIAAGKYDERLELSALLRPEEADELGQLATSFNQMAEALESTETRRRELIANVAHELRTPLTSIQGYMEAMQDGVMPANDDTFERVRHEAQRLQRLVSDLQELSRVEAGAVTLELKPVPVATLVAAVVGRLGRQFEDKGVALKTDVSDGLSPVRVDEDRTGQVLTNLLGNALQYTPAGGQVCLSARAEGSEVHLAIRDTGAGIAPEHLPHIFDRFYRVDKSRSRAGGGTGIGLTIARHLAEAQGGRIWAESPGSGQGSTFHVTLPSA